MNTWAEDQQDLLLNQDSEEWAKKRKHRRIFFSAKDGVKGELTIGIPEKKITADILNISESGVGFSIYRDEDLLIAKGIRFVLNQIKGTAELAIMRDVETEIKWVFNHAGFKHIGFGCEFKNTPDTVVKKLRDYIDSWDE